MEKRRRGPDFFANTRLALEPALRGQVDLVVHGGDLLYRSKVPAGLVAQALEPLLEVADNGVPVVLVPGNHERSALPYPMLASHRNLHVLDRPKTVELEISGARVAIGGFPCERDDIRDRFSVLVAECGVLSAQSRSSNFVSPPDGRGISGRGIHLQIGRRYHPWLRYTDWRRRCSLRPYPPLSDPDPGPCGDIDSLHRSSTRVRSSAPASPSGMNPRDI